MARAERSRSVRAVLASALPRTACSEVHTPWAMGLNRVARVQSAAMPMVPAPRKRTWELHIWVARSLMAWPSAGVALMVSSGTATPADEHADEDGDAGGDAHQVAGADQGEENPVVKRKAVCPAVAQTLMPSPSTLKPLLQAEGPGHQAAAENVAQAGLVLVMGGGRAVGALVIAAADTQDLRCRHAFGVGQLALHHHHPAQGMV